MLELLVEQVAAFLDPPLLLAELAAALLDLGVDRLAALEGLFLGLEVGLLADGLGLAAGGGEDLLGDAPGGLGPEPGIGEGAGQAPRNPEDQSDQDPDGCPVHVAALPFLQGNHAVRRAGRRDRRHNRFPRGPGTGSAEKGERLGSNARGIVAVNNPKRAQAGSTNAARPGPGEGMGLFRGEAADRDVAARGCPRPRGSIRLPVPPDLVAADQADA